jgi:hypothetical protein
MSNDTPHTFHDVMKRLRTDLDLLIMETVNAPLQAAIAQIPAIMQRKDLTEETKKEMLEELQLSIVAPFIGTLVYAALGAHMDLPTLLYNIGQGWEEIRAKHMAQAAQEILNRNNKGPNEETTE